MDEDQKMILLTAMLMELGEKGYGDASLAGAAQAAGIRQDAVEAEFGDKDDCLFAAYDLLCEEVMARTSAVSCSPEASWPERIRSGLSVLLREIAAYPMLAQVATRSFPAIRPAAYERYVELVGRFMPYFEEGRDYSGLGEKLPDEVELLAVGAAEALIFSEVDAGRANRLPGMMPEILFSVLVPFIGPDRASDEMQSAGTAS
jgi:AcrR family transcriptional regulator